uniref:Ubiquitin conjugating enzyme E2 E2 n=1 Tax=Ovis aries TaxID=9940 RepID=A0AC11EBI3_SHEEP
MSTEAQRVDDSPGTSGGSSDGDQRESVQQEPEREQVQPKKKEGKISSKTAAKLSTSAKRIQKELAEITLDPPPNCRILAAWVQMPLEVSTWLSKLGALCELGKDACTLHGSPEPEPSLAPWTDRCTLRRTQTCRSLW